MGTRLFNGNTNSEDGWPYVDQGSCTWVTVPGTDPAVNLQIQNGQPLTIMSAFAADINAYVEKLRDPDSACWTEGNSVATSNHPGGTAMDLNWDTHPFQTRGTFSAEQLAIINELLDFYEGTIFWGGRWDDPIDEMHWQMGGDTFNNPHTADVIARKIRPDGFSTFRRENVPIAPPASAAPPPMMTVPLTQNVDGTWTSPSPAWAHLITRESGGDPTIIQQIIDVNSGGNEAEGLFQITPRTWLAHGGDEFAATPRLATPQQQAIVAARIFTRNPSGSDWGAGLPGREDANQLAIGLVPTTVIPTPPVPTPVQSAPQPSLEEDWMPDPDLAQMIREIHTALFEKLPSKSRYAKAVGGGPLWTVLEEIRNDDGFWFDDVVERNALRGDQWSQEAIEKSAANGDKLAQAFMDQHLGSGKHHSDSTARAAAPSTPASTSAPTSGVTINNTILMLAAQMQNLKQQISDAIGG